ncbi:MAG TPA: mechanosensitive ion channel family protein [Chryseolinea sp.]
MEDFLSRTYLNNTMQDYLIAAAGIVVGIILIPLFRKVLLRPFKHLAGRTETKIDDFVVDSIENFGLPILNLLIIYFGINYLTLSEKAEKYIHGAFVVLVTYYAVRLVSSTVLLVLQSYVRKYEDGEEKVKQLGGIMLLINVFIWAIGALSIFSNLGYDVTTIVAGLGIGGIAIALAAQNILGDLFNYFVIFFDRPFEIGDFIVIDDKKGTVEHIGIKTTRLKGLGGEQLIIANSDLTNSRIHNFKRMEHRRISFTLGVVYDTSLEQLKEIPDIIKSIIASTKDITLDRVHFLSYGDYSLKYEVVFFVETADYNRYADIHQEINFKIYEEFQQKNIKFAYPSQTIFMAPGNPS